jgi:radical SAM superfamily enzyme YgiQ (UPF0313 family)
MRILLINPPYTRYGGIEGHGGMAAPLNLAYIAAYLRACKPDVEVAIGITCPTPAYYNVCKMVSDLKEPDVKIVLGGPHPTALPVETLRETKANFVIVGEGEVTFLELVEALEKGNDVGHVNGIGYWHEGIGPILNPPRDLINDLDALPFPAKDLLPQERYYLPPTKRIRSSRATNMITSRGCPHDCTFCMAKVMWGRNVPYRSVHNVLCEIESNVGSGLTEFSFHDEYFTANKRRVSEFCAGIMERGFDISWSCQARAGSVDLETLKLMKRAGCGKIAFGFESGSQRILDLMNKRETIDEIVQSVALCNHAGIAVEGAFLIGYPGETEEDIEKTIDLACSLDCETVAFFTAIPYPGTHLYEIAKEKGYLGIDVDWRDFAPVSNRNSPMTIPGLTHEQLRCFKKKAYNSFYLRPRHILRQLAKIRSFADVINLMRGFKIFWNLLWSKKEYSGGNT